MSRRASQDGYSQDKIGPVDYKLSFVFDYSDVNRRVRDVRRAVQDMGNQMFKLNKRIQKSNSGFGVWIETPKPTEFVNRSMRAILPAGAEQIQIELTKDAQKFGEEVKNIMRKYVNRIETGRMKREIRYKITKRNLKTLTVDVGWIRLWYKYFDYQERGTSQVRPMNSLFKTRMEAEPMFYKLYSRFTRTYVLSANKRGTTR